MCGSNEDDLFDEDSVPSTRGGSSSVGGGSSGGGGAGSKEFHDNDDFSSTYEHTRSTHTEKITTNRKSRSSRKIDLGASTDYGKEDNDSKVLLLS